MKLTVMERQVLLSDSWVGLHALPPCAYVMSLHNSFGCCDALHDALGPAACPLLCRQRMDFLDLE